MGHFDIFTRLNMEQYRRLLHEYWPRIALWGGLALLAFLFFGKFFLWFAAKAIFKIIGLLLIGIGLLFRRNQHKINA